MVHCGCQCSISNLSASVIYLTALLWCIMLHNSNNCVLGACVYPTASWFLLVWTAVLESMICAWGQMYACIESPLHQLDFFLEIFLWRLQSYNPLAFDMSSSWCLHDVAVFPYMHLKHAWEYLRCMNGQNTAVCIYPCICYDPIHNRWPDSKHKLCRSPNSIGSLLILVLRYLSLNNIPAWRAQNKKELAITDRVKQNLTGTVQPPSPTPFMPLFFPSLTVCVHVCNVCCTSQNDSLASLKYSATFPFSLTPGNDFPHEKMINIDRQVQLLIEQATSHENLCQCYIGWCPFW